MSKATLSPAALWDRWVQRTERLVDARVLALLRILLCACVLADLLRIEWLGLVDDFYRLYEHGGINAHPDTAGRLVQWLGDDGGMWAYWASVALFALGGLGLGTRPAMLGAVLVYAQLGHLYNPGDRGIDRIVRTVLLVLVFSQSHRRLALWTRLRPADRRDWIPAWPMDVVRWLMVMIYLSAGLAKVMQQPLWLGMPDKPVVYRIMTDPMAAWVDPAAAEPFWALWVFCGWATIAVEVSAPLLLTRWGRYWSLAALPMHLGIASFMDLGMFSYAMMSLHVLLLYPWILPLLDRVPALRNRQPPPPGAWIDDGSARRPAAASPGPTPAA